MVVCVVLVHVTIKIVEPLLPGHSGRSLANVTQAPLADERRLVTRFLQRLRHRDIVRFQSLGRWIGITGIAPHSRVSVMQARHEHTARRRAHRRSRVKMREAHALRRHAIQVRRGDDFLPVTAQIRIPQIIRQDPDQVRFRLGASLAKNHRRGDKSQENKKSVFHAKGRRSD